MSDSNVYTAERILAKRKYHGVTQYYIKWKGYSIKDSTWEPAENILDRSLLVAFENAPPSKKAKTIHAPDHSSSSGAANSSSNSRSTATSRSSQNSRRRNESRASSTSSASSSSLKRGRGRPRKSYVEQRQEQVRLQRHIELQQQQRTHLVQNTTVNTNNTNDLETKPETIAATISSCNNNNNNTNGVSDKKQLVIFNPVGGRTEMEVVEEVVYEPELTKDPVLVTDVTSKDLTVTISECRTPEGFFRT